MQIGVTGSRGFLPKHLIEELKDRRHKVITVDRSDSGGALDRHTMFGKFMECDYLIHLATVGLRESIGHPTAAVSDIVGMALQCAEVARHFGTTIINCSSSEVFGTAETQFTGMDERHSRHPKTPYAAGKVAQDAIIEAFASTYGIDYTTVRPFNMYGPGAHWKGARGEVIPKMIVRALSGKPVIVHGDGSQTRDFVYVKDVASIICDIVETPREIVSKKDINICTGIETNILTIASLISEELGVAMNFEPGRPGDVQRHMGDSSTLRRLGLLKERFKPFKKGLIETRRTNR
jgi:UDP-glucose 4-epimerase